MNTLICCAEIFQINFAKISLPNSPPTFLSHMDYSALTLTLANKDEEEEEENWAKTKNKQTNKLSQFIKALMTWTTTTHHHHQHQPTAAAAMRARSVYRVNVSWLYCSILFSSVQFCYLLVTHSVVCVLLFSHTHQPTTRPSSYHYALLALYMVW